MSNTSERNAAESMEPVIEHRQNEVRRLDRKAKKLAKKLARRAEQGWPERAELTASKRLRRLERQQAEAMRGLSEAVIYSLRD